jgi:trehalose-6-phosphatase
MRDLLKKTMQVKEAEDEVQKTSKRTIALDFDGVIHSYTSGWTSAADIPDAPVEGAKEAIAELRKEYSVAIYSARAGQPGGKEAIEKWLADNGIEVDEISAEKPPAHVYVDDRGITFRGDWPDTLAKIKTFKSYLGEVKEQFGWMG